MPKPYPYSQVGIDVDAGTETQLLREPPVEPDTPFRILMLGDFTGRANRGVFEPSLAGRTPVAVDRDNFEMVMQKLAPELRLPNMAMHFRELDDFHPDRIYAQAPLFAALRQMRDRLSDRATFAAAAAALRPAAPGPPRAEPPPRIDLDELFNRTLEETEARAPERRAIDDFTALVRDIVTPHLEPKADPQQAELVAKVDEATTEQMRAFLHHRQFQSLEAAWRAVFFLVRRVETGTDLKLFLLDVSKEELAENLRSTPDLRATGLYRIAVEQTVGTPGAQPWAVLAGAYTFDDGIEDVVLLGYLGALARAAGAPFLAAASPHVVGCESPGQTPAWECWSTVPADAERSWQVLRSLPEARWIGLALPRFLLRLPYGKETDPVERFAFEEAASPPEHEAYLWGNPAFACVCLLAQAFSKEGWEMRPGSVRDIDNLPLHVYRAGGEAHVKPCAEALLTEEAAERILEQGIMPLVSLKDRDQVRLLRFQSLAEPPSALEGRWAN